MPSIANTLLILMVLGLLDAAVHRTGQRTQRTQFNVKGLVEQLNLPKALDVLANINPYIPRSFIPKTKSTKPGTNPAVDQPASEESIRMARNFLEQEIRRNNGLIPKFVRIGFHTCFGREGCNGCLDVTDSHNRGLLASYSTLRSWYRTNSYSLTFADFVALAATEAFEFGISNADCNGRQCSRNVPFKSGRKTCLDIENPPKVTLIEGDDVDGLNKLSQSFDLTREEAIALIGFHSLGRCRATDSGFEGPWDDSELAADRGYFDHMSREAFRVNQIRSPVQWNDATGRLMFLTPDLTCKYVINLDENGRPTCASDIRKCPLASTSKLVDTYANDTTAWQTAAVPVFLKMIEKSAQPLY